MQDYYYIQDLLDLSSGSKPAYLIFMKEIVSRDHYLANNPIKNNHRTITTNTTFQKKNTLQDY